ncbi:MAG: type IX secretion system sortase PorU [Bacteroidales bacterium]|nr:type IX secretion system sortase PorU [Bacteroidales bacterium]
MRIIATIFISVFFIASSLAQQYKLSGSSRTEKNTDYPVAGSIFTDFDSRPFFFENLGLISQNEEFTPQLIVKEVKIINNSEIPVEIINALSNTFSVFPQISSIKKQNYAGVYISCLRKNSQTGQTEMLVDYEITFTTHSAPLKTNIPQKIFAANSVLSSGTWYKISTTQHGIHRITYDDVESWGIDPTGINPQNIRIYGNGPHMLPEANNEKRYDDLIENSIYVEGESDGSFDQGDYILFYSDGIQYWNYDSASMSFSHENNLFNDENYFFINFDLGPGQRISDLNSSTSAATDYCTQFYDFRMHEVDQYNLLKSGKIWLGETFESVSSSQNFSFSLANLIPDSSVFVTAAVAGRASTATLFSLSSGTASNNISIPATSGYVNDYAKYSTGSIYINNSSSLISVNLTYNTGGNTEAIGWLDYIEVKAWRALSFAGNQMAFRNHKISGSGNIVEYTLSNAANVTVWDVSDPLHPRNVVGSLSGTDLNFRLNNDSLKEFMSFNGLLYYNVDYEGLVSNQNLHASPQTDYIIVSHSSFKSQANSIGQIHANLEGYSYLVVTPQEIYNEYSSGKQDPAAIRDFLKMFYDRAGSASELPRFLLLLGDASYDYKNRITNNNNLVSTFESRNSLSPTNSYASDDFFGLLDNNEGNDCSGNLDIAIGRLPINSIEEADAMVVKLQKYTSDTKLADGTFGCSSGECTISNMADWRNNICFVCDDEDGNLHLTQADRLAKKVDTTYNFLNVDKIYLDAFNQISTTGGERAPEVNDAIDQRVEKGALIINYTGHGGEVGWAHERILELSSIQNWTNSCNLPVFLTATCEFSRFDDPGRTSAGEYVLINPNGGGIALLTTTRLAFSTYNEALNTSFYEKAFDNSSGAYMTLGELTAYSKYDNGSIVYLRNFSLLGDPALTMSIPKNQIITSTINGINVAGYTDTVGALSKITVTGYIADPLGTKISDYNGTLYPTVFDKATTLTTLASNPESYETNFTLQKNIIYRGKASIVNGDFSFTFIVPKDIQYNYGAGRISYYAENGSTDATGWFEEFIIGGSSDSLIVDLDGPEIELYMNNDQFISGGLTDENPIFLAYLKDENGINTVGTGIGHDLIATIDNNTADAIVLNDYYEADINSYQSGQLMYPLKGISEGTHTLQLKAWDIMNNSSESSIEFVVSSSASLALSHVLNYPNPFTTYTEFWFEHNHPCCVLDVQVQIFTITGRLVKTINQQVQTNGFRAEPISWDGTDDYGSPLAKGVYIYRIRIKSEEGGYAEKSEKLVILK